jgi:hypothetical protein
MNSLDVSTDQLRRALQIKEQIESLEQQLTSLLSGGASTRNPNLLSAGKGRRTMSASARARIAAAQRARWAKVKKNGAAGASPRKRRKMSAAGRARIAAAARARWARYNAGK